MPDVTAFTFITNNENDEFEVVIEYDAGFMAQCLGGDDTKVERYVQRAPTYMWHNKETGKLASPLKDLEILALLEQSVNSEKECDDLIVRLQLSSLPKRV